ncbi:glycosyltransferase [Flavobacterium sp. LHD-85]|uniref:glycosyltransferase n=1 Tax=Flavobacterium sp. LHD-85 TaxID=3071410 RepID=UPI0027E07C4E|nr:glycosyltransferase [Flavobacterium sp. LHD-85]MDQ6529639.1 glycosyltransferase [Flavobacterium sp. LHD-85]
MRIVQIIDSLEVGGAERMAVNYANKLSEKIEFSGLVVTRCEGSLLNQVNKSVHYLFLNKKSSLDLKAAFRLKSFIKKNKVDIIHAHSSSFFIAVLVKFIYPKIRIIWHDHYGPRISESKKENKVLRFSSVFFISIFVVNKQLREWSQKYMHCKKVVFIPNFIQETQFVEQTTVLQGSEGKRIVFLANLKKPKNHFTVLEAFFELKLFDLGWSLHLIGKDYFDLYSQNLKDFIKSKDLYNHVHLYGARNDVSFILKQASVGILASTFEGFPVTLIEYGKAKLGVISTNVGFCSEIIKDKETGLLFNPLCKQELLSQLKKITENESLRNNIAVNLKKIVADNYEADIVIETIILEYSKIEK